MKIIFSLVIWIVFVSFFALSTSVAIQNYRLKLKKKIINKRIFGEEKDRYAKSGGNKDRKKKENVSNNRGKAVVRYFGIL